MTEQGRAHRGILRKYNLYYTTSMIVAALTFGATHGVQSIVGDFGKEGPNRYLISTLFVLCAYEFIQTAAFLFLGWPTNYFVAKFAFRFYVDRGWPERSSYAILVGALVGLAFLPLCALLQYLISLLDTDASYLARCAQYFWPMLAAGGAGGYTFWRCARSEITPSGKRIADQFL